MKVKLKAGWSRTFFSLTPGNLYRVITRSEHWVRVMDDLGDPIQCSLRAFTIVDPTPSPGWIGVDGESEPAELDSQLYEQWHDKDADAIRRLKGYLHNWCVEDRNRNDNANRFFALSDEHFVEIDEDGWEIRKLRRVDGRWMQWDDRDAPSDDTLQRIEPAGRELTRQEFEAMLDATFEE